VVEELPRDQVIDAIDEMVSELLTRAAIARPPVDCIELAQLQLGMVVCLDERQPQRGRAQRSGQQRHIYLRPEPTLERHQWTVAHEIGEHLKAELLKRLRLEPEQTRAMTGESLANLFAYHLLVPNRWFQSDAPEMDYDLLTLKDRYATSSHEVIAWRMLDLPARCIITIIDKEHVYRRRSNAWPIRRKLEPAEEKCQRQVHHRGQPRRVQENGWTVQGWPVHQADWKREILRSVVDASVFGGD
jgi:Zn-dependent peptidase ImmA (M78 family)